MMNRSAHIVRAIRASLATLAFSALPLIASAQTSGGGTLKNPTSFSTIQDFIAAFLKGIVEISLPILTLFIVYAGFLFVSARGNQSKLETAKENFVYVIIGAILILGAWILATLIGATVTQVIGTS